MIRDVHHNLVAPVRVDGRSGDGAVHGHCGAGDAIWGDGHLVNREPVFSSGSSVGDDNCMVSVYVIVAPSLSGMGCVATTGLRFMW